ncbi:SRPBCC domain-containing protein [Bradyrhizobium sp. SZCCHNRI1029]|uniref:SRPBCC family protein n=1 Tax=Bradyrhizobium sp. SZCCHNRI1029 TaxID=3057278 RepID=UPI002915D86F|nr:SRPBCC domain-containing protein [Bradyrhizobium sp. SZCCHNRI1029]
MSKPSAVETRVITLKTEIAAQGDEVWRALTDARELMRWFPLEAEVQPGAGGSMRLSWGDPVVAEWRITDWRPGVRLEVSEMRPLGILLQPRDEVAPTRKVEFELDALGGTTRLRLRHVGFGAGAGWDEVFHAVRRGWEFQLCSLRHYLDRHVGTDRMVARKRHSLALSAEQAWSRLIGAGGLFRTRATETGSRCELRIGSDTYGAKIEVFDPPRQLAVVLAGMKDAMFRIYIVETAADKVELSSWLASYGVSGPDVEAFESRLTGMLNGLLFPPLPSQGAAAAVQGNRS